LVGCLNAHNELSLINYSPSGEQLNCHVMKLGDLPPPERAQVQGVIPAGSLDEAEAQLRTLSAKALLPCPPPRATSPPADPSGTSEPNATPLPTSSTPPSSSNPNGIPPSTPTAAPAPPVNTLPPQTVTTLPPPPQQPGVDCRAAA
jgi:PPM family protein phosphatase